MGAFFNNVHIRKNDVTTLEVIQENIISMMKNGGYKQVDKSEDADINFDIYFSEGEWVSLYSDFFEFNDDISIEKMIKPFSEALNTDVLAIACFDSDFLFMNLINVNDETNAWANVGMFEYGPLPRETAYTSWEKKVKDIEAFKNSIEEDYIFAEEVFSSLEDNLELPARQATLMPEMYGDMENQDNLHKLYFAISNEKEPKELPKLAITRYSLMPSWIGKSDCIPVINKGDASTGIVIAFTGNYVENDEITFTNLSLEYGHGENIQKFEGLKLEKRQNSKGNWIYYCECPNFPLLPKIKDGLPMSKYMDLEFEKEFVFRYTPQGNSRKMLDISVHFLPMKNPEGQCCWCVWKDCGSKENYIKDYNETWEDSLNMELLNPDDFDL